MRGASTALDAHLAGGVTTLATCWRITRRDGVEHFFTDHDRDIVFEGNVYRARTGWTRTAIANEAGLAVDNLDVVGVFDSSEITEEDLRAGRFDGAEVRVFLVNWADPSQGALKLRRGWLGEVVVGERGIFRAELRGLAQALSQVVGEVYTPECRADLGDARCRVPIWPPEIQRSTAYAVGDYVRVPTGTGAGSQVYEDRIYRCVTAGTTAATQPAYDTTVGAQTADGTAVFEAEEAWSRSATVAAVTDARTFTVSVAEARAVDGWFAGGLAVFESGPNAGIVREVAAWTQASGLVELFLPLPFVPQPGDVLRLSPGCDKRLATCRDRFGNVLNFRGEPYVPGADALMQYPDAG